MFSRWFVVTLSSLCFMSAGLSQGGGQASTAGIQGPLRCRYARSVQAPEGTIYLLGTLKTTDGGRRLIPAVESDAPLGTQLFGTRLTSLLWRKGLFLGVYWAVDCDRQGRCVGKMWRSTDGLKTVQKEDTLVWVSETGVVPRDEFSEVAGERGSRHLFFHRGIREMTDGSLLAPMIGSFEQDTAVPNDPRSQAETPRKMRAFLVRSTDQGKTWRYLATIAAPRASDVDDTEGYNECAIQPLDDGRLLAVMRTGHYSALVASWSSDGGKTWTDPLTPSGLENGVDPFLLKLAAGRLALAFGQMMPRTGPKKANYRDEDTRRRCRLALSRDATGEDWTVVTVADFAERSAYPTIFEAEPNVIVYQSDLDLWRIELDAQ